MYKDMSSYREGKRGGGKKDDGGRGSTGRQCTFAWRGEKRHVVDQVNPDAPRQKENNIIAGRFVNNMKNRWPYPVHSWKSWELVPTPTPATIRD